MHNGYPLEADVESWKAAFHDAYIYSIPDLIETALDAPVPLPKAVTVPPKGRKAGLRGLVESSRKVLPRQQRRGPSKTLNNWGSNAIEEICSRRTGLGIAQLQIISESDGVVNIPWALIDALLWLCPYSTSKAAQLHLSRLVAHDEGRHGIRVNSVYLGFIFTDGTRKHAEGVGRTGSAR
jgi:NAD(P)-dependent dehydrogenase (short-subunit alcohol dehydrogenase family)